MNLKEKRIKSNIKIKGICEKLGISRSTYYLMEKGERKVRPYELDKLNSLFKEG